MAKRSTPEPFRYRGAWRAQVTLANGDRPAQNFETKHEAAEWIRDQLAHKNTKDAAELGGPTTASLAQALHLYAHRYTITKGGGDSGLNRINHYLTGVGLPWLRRVTDSEGKVSLEGYQLSAQPSGWQASQRCSARQARQDLRAHRGVGADAV